jgi:hypothetical protein
VFGYSAYRIFEESLRIDSSVHIFGLRLNMYIASVLAVVGAVWFYRTQHRPERALAAVSPADRAPADRAPADGTPADRAPAGASAQDAPARAPAGAAPAPGDHTRDPEDAAPGPPAM